MNASDELYRDISPLVRHKAQSVTYLALGAIYYPAACLQACREIIGDEKYKSLHRSKVSAQKTVNILTALYNLDSRPALLPNKNKLARIFKTTPDYISRMHKAAIIRKSFANPLGYEISGKGIELLKCVHDYIIIDIEDNLFIQFTPRVKKVIKSEFTKILLQISN